MIFRSFILLAYLFILAVAQDNTGCDSGWHRFDRPSGGWCVKSFGGFFQQLEAELKCRDLNATLSGIQNLEEAKYMTSSALPLLPQSSGSLWVGMQRSLACHGQRITPICTAQNSFHWTDNSAADTAGFLWDNTQPDNYYDRMTSNCAMLLASGSDAPIKVNDIFWTPNRLDDVDCVMDPLDKSPRGVVGYVCGKEASVFE